MHRNTPDLEGDADALLRQAASDHQLWSVARGRAEAGDAAASRIADTCTRIHAATVAEATRLEALAGSREVQAHPDPSGQLHLVRLICGNRDAARRSVRALIDDGYVPWQRIDGAAEEVYLRTQSQRTFVHLGDVTRTVIVQWPESRLALNIPEPLRPTERDWNTVELPPKAWWGYFAVRPARLARERLFGSQPAVLPLGPILSTPVDLIDKLLRFAELESDDHLVDLGCGDGRVLERAVSGFGCRASGIEQDEKLVARARARIDGAGLSGQIAVHHGDANSFDLSDATVVFLFIPAEHVARVAKQIRDHGFSGRIISHEQRFVDGSVQPVESTVLLGDLSLTVAHRW